MLVFLFIHITHSKLSKCKSVNEFVKDHSSNMKATFNISKFLQKNLPGANAISDMPRVGKGSFGSVYKTQILSNDRSVWIPAVMKVIRPKAHHKVLLDQELSIMQNLAKNNPLYLLKYFSCVHTDSTAFYDTLFIFTESLECNLIDSKFKNGFRPQKFGYQLELISMMVKGIQVFHHAGWGHFDIKPENYMFGKTSTNHFIKIIDYGLAHPFGKNTTCGTADYKDPYMWDNNYRLNGKSDIYSLGITLHEILMNAGDVIGSDADFKSFAAVKRFHTSRRNKLIKKHSTNLALREAGEKTQFKAFTDLIEKMIALDPNNRPDIDVVVNTIETLLSQLKPDSTYLKANQGKLYNKLYGEYNEALEPGVSDRQPMAPKMGLNIQAVQQRPAQVHNEPIPIDTARRRQNTVNFRKVDKLVNDNMILAVGEDPKMKRVVAQEKDTRKQYIAVRSKNKNAQHPKEITNIQVEQKVMVKQKQPAANVGYIQQVSHRVENHKIKDQKKQQHPINFQERNKIMVANGGFMPKQFEQIKIPGNAVKKDIIIIKENVNEQDYSNPYKNVGKRYEQIKNFNQMPNNVQQVQHAIIQRKLI